MYIYIICTFDVMIGEQNECREGVHNNRKRIKKIPSSNRKLRDEHYNAYLYISRRSV